MFSEFNLLVNKDVGLVSKVEEFDSCLLALAFGLCSALTVVSTDVVKFPKGITETDVSTVLTELLTYSEPLGFSFLANLPVCFELLS